MSEEQIIKDGDVQIDVSIDLQGGSPLRQMDIAIDMSGNERLTDLGAAFGQWYKGEKGDKGDPFRFEDFTPEQLASLREGVGAGGSAAADTVHTFDSVLDFPSIGSEQNIYIAKDENATYRWNEVDLHYYCIGRNYGEIDIIDGVTI